MSGKVVGVDLFLDEVIREREPPRRKVWETVGTPRLEHRSLCRPCYPPQSVAACLPAWLAEMHPAAMGTKSRESIYGASILPDCGHWTQQEKAAEVNSLLIEFLRRSDLQPSIVRSSKKGKDRIVTTGQIVYQPAKRLENRFA
jgi:hypothetical protein